MPNRLLPLRRVGVVALVLLACGACGGSGGDAAPTTTSLATTPTLPSTTTIALTPDQAFDQALTDQLDGVDAEFIGGSRAAGHTLCDNLTALAAEGGEANGVDDPTPALLIGAVLDGYTQPAVAAVVLRATGEHLCPEHGDAIEQVLTANGQ